MNHRAVLVLVIVAAMATVQLVASFAAGPRTTGITANVNNGQAPRLASVALADNASDNSSSDNSGSDNSSNDNSGSDNSGSDNSSNDNSGSDNSGSDNSSNDNSGSDNSGSDNSSNDNSGSSDNSSSSDNSGSSDGGAPSNNPDEIIDNVSVSAAPAAPTTATSTTAATTATTSTASTASAPTTSTASPSASPTAVTEVSATATGIDSTLALPGNRVTVQIPASLPSGTVLKLRMVDPLSLPPTSGIRAGDLIFQLDATDASGAALTTLPSEVTIKATYSDRDVIGLNEANLTLGHLDVSSSQWSPAPKLVPDAIGHSISATVTATGAYSAYVQ